MPIAGQVWLAYQVGHALYKGGVAYKEAIDQCYGGGYVSVHKQDHPHHAGPERTKRGLSWPVKAVLLSLALLAGFFEHAIGEWAGPSAMAAIALVMPILLFRRFWSQTWFWRTAVLLGAIQVPLVVAVRPLIQQARSFYMLSFVLIDGLLVIGVISLASPKSNDRHT